MMCSELLGLSGRLLGGGICAQSVPSKQKATQFREESLKDLEGSASERQKDNRNADRNKY